MPGGRRPLHRGRPVAAAARRQPQAAGGPGAQPEVRSPLLTAGCRLHLRVGVPAAGCPGVAGVLAAGRSGVQACRLIAAAARCWSQAADCLGAQSEVRWTLLTAGCWLPWRAGVPVAHHRGVVPGAERAGETVPALHAVSPPRCQFPLLARPCSVARAAPSPLQEVRRSPVALQGQPTGPAAVMGSRS